MAYTLIPKNINEIEQLNDADLCLIYTTLININPDISSPIAIEPSKKKLKILREFIPSISDIENKLDIKFSDKNVAHYNSKHIMFGSGSRGNKGSSNRGILFEDHLCADLKLYNTTGIEQCKYKNLISKLVDKLNLNKIDKVIPTGKLNTNRPLNITDDNILIGDDYNVGKLISDIIINDNHFLSLKWGHLVTFFNNGIKRILPDDDIKFNSINRKGQSLLNLFGIDSCRFCDIFNYYGHPEIFNDNSEKIDVTTDVDINKITSLLKSGIGYGYWLVHMIKNNSNVYYIDEPKLNDMIKVNRVIVKYPKIGLYKRVDINIETPNYLFNINIRNKQGGVYPTHIMCDYKYNNYGE